MFYHFRFPPFTAAENENDKTGGTILAVREIGTIVAVSSDWHETCRIRLGLALFRSNGYLGGVQKVNPLTLGEKTMRLTAQEIEAKIEQTSNALDLAVYGSEEWSVLVDRMFSLEVELDEALGLHEVPAWFENEDFEDYDKGCYPEFEDAWPGNEAVDLDDRY